MAEVTVIGRGTRVRGRVVGAASLEIQGHVDGDVSVEGDVTVDAEGLVGANVSGRRLVVRGAIKGDLSGSEAVVLEEGARVVGDVRAPRIAIAPGALVRGYVQTGSGEGRPRAAARPAVRAVPTPVKAAPKPAAAPAPVKVVAAPKPAPRTAPVALAGAAPPMGRSPAAPAATAPKGPPPPVVPALKKGAKGALNKKKAH